MNSSFAYNRRPRKRTWTFGATLTRDKLERPGPLPRLSKGDMSPTSAPFFPPSSGSSYTVDHDGTSHAHFSFRYSIVVQRARWTLPIGTLRRFIALVEAQGATIQWRLRGPMSTWIILRRFWKRCPEIVINWRNNQNIIQKDFFSQSKFLRLQSKPYKAITLLPLVRYASIIILHSSCCTVSGTKFLEICPTTVNNPGTTSPPPVLECRLTQSEPKRTHW